MTPSDYIGHSAYRVVVSERWPPKGNNTFCSWMQRSDGTVVLYIRGMATTEGETRMLRDFEVREAFGTLNVCHACVGLFGCGRLFRPTDRVPWTNTQRLEYKEHFGTTDRRGKRSPWGQLCEPCRFHFAEKATDAFCKEMAALGFEKPIISSPELMEQTHDRQQPQRTNP